MLHWMVTGTSLNQRPSGGRTSGKIKKLGEPPQRQGRKPSPEIVRGKTRLTMIVAMLRGCTSRARRRSLPRLRRLRKPAGGKASYAPSRDLFRDGFEGRVCIPRLAHTNTHT